MLRVGSRGGILPYSPRGPLCTGSPSSVSRPRRLQGRRQGQQPDDSSSDDSAAVQWECVLPKDAVDPEFSQQIGCQTDFDLLAPRIRSTPRSRARTRARPSSTGSTRTPSTSRTASCYPIHWDFVLDAPVAATACRSSASSSTFNTHRVLQPGPPLHPRRGHLLRRPDMWVYEISPVRHRRRRHDRDGVPR